MITKSFASKVLHGSLLIGGTAVGAGMLGIPLITHQAGFIPALAMTVLVWLYMLATGLLLLEATLWLEDGANILSLSKRFLGKNGRAISGLVYLFLYYTLIIAYFSAGSPFFSSFFLAVFGLKLPGFMANLLFGITFFTIVGLGIKSVDRVNYILMVGLVASFLLLIAVGVGQVEFKSLEITNFSKSLLAAPLLFGAFGYHNVIPSLTSYFNRNEKVMRYSIIFGTSIPLIVYILWQFVIIGALPFDLMQEALDKGQPVTYALKTLTNKPWIQTVGQVFAFFAIVTSVMGVGFAMVDFLGDGLKIKRVGRSRFLLCALTFFPPFLLSSLDPSLFILALSLAGGFGEAYLNGMLPVLMVYKGRYKSNLPSSFKLFGKKPMLAFLFLVALLVILLETTMLFS